MTIAIAIPAQVKALAATSGTWLGVSIFMLGSLLGVAGLILSRGWDRLFAGFGFALDTAAILYLVLMYIGLGGMAH